MQVDQEKARRVVAALRAQADTVASFIDDSDALHAELVRQASQGTRSGAPAPGYRPLVTIHRALMDRHKAVYADAAARLHHAADVLEAAAAAAEAADVDAAAAIDRIWDESGWGAAAAGGGLSGAGWWQAQAAGASPAGVRFRAESDPADAGSPPPLRFRAESDRAGAGSPPPLRFRGAGDVASIRWTTGGDVVEPPTRFRPPRQVVGEEGRQP
ncbi:hypothetical protein CSPHI_10365 [Corynebacterium sphenisci DSM 44792]|uniref:Uncharacterized protein n=2 Tax=Corynebacterium sphenisci TaxID=191493 RepID=A0A1L7CZS5_9CORY|nr:hypothetical protein CSPHI_10365 [Corynebacterium sphenisci DSM 44792]